MEILQTAAPSGVADFGILAQVANQDCLVNRCHYAASCAGARVALRTSLAAVNAVMAAVSFEAVAALYAVT